MSELQDYDLNNKLEYELNYAKKNGKPKTDMPVIDLTMKI